MTPDPVYAAGDYPVAADFGGAYVNDASDKKCTDRGNYVDLSYPSYIPADAKTVILKAYAASNGGGMGGRDTSLYVKEATNNVMPEDLVVTAIDGNNDTSADTDTNIFEIPYSNDRKFQVKWNTSNCTYAGVRLYIIGYTQ